MKTHKVRPTLVATKNRVHETYMIDKLEYHTDGRLSINGVEQQLILISLDPNDKIEVGDKCLIKWGVDIGGKDLYEISTCTNIGISGIHYFDEMSMCFGQHEITDKIKKVIAVQDQLSPEYIQQFIEEYRNGKVKDVEINMEQIGAYANPKYSSDYKPKLNNGFVTITEESIEVAASNYAKAHPGNTGDKSLDVAVTAGFIEGAKFGYQWGKNKKK